MLRTAVFLSILSPSVWQWAGCQWWITWRLVVVLDFRRHGVTPLFKLPPWLQMLRNSSQTRSWSFRWPPRFPSPTHPLFCVNLKLSLKRFHPASHSGNLWASQRAAGSKTQNWQRKIFLSGGRNWQGRLQDKGRPGFDLDMVSTWLRLSKTSLGWCYYLWGCKDVCFSPVGRKYSNVNKKNKKKHKSQKNWMKSIKNIFACWFELSWVVLSGVSSF